MGLLKGLFGGGSTEKPAAAVSESLPYEPGTTIAGDHVVRALLGRGGMGEVYLVERLSDGDLRAAKVMRSHRGASAADLLAFRQEALSLLNVGTHPFLVHLHEVREDGHDTVLLMEYVAPTSGCTSIQDYITRTRDYTDRLLGIWGVQFCVAMEHAQGCGMQAHRDIKPANLLVGAGAFLKVADFGLALAASRHSGIMGDTPGQLSALQVLASADGRRTCGTPGYIAPEQVSGDPVTARTDIYSAAAVIYEAITGRRYPPLGETQDALRDREADSPARPCGRPVSGLA